MADIDSDGIQAMPDEDIITMIDYKKISPYMEIGLVDVYVNQQ